MSVPKQEDLRPRKRSVWKRVLGGLLTLFLIATVWAAISRNQYAQGVRALFGRTPDQVIIDRTFTVGPRSFRFYKFTVPEGSSHMAVTGHFSVAAESGENAIELLVLSEDQLAQWQTGTPVQAIYESGRVPQGNIQADLPRSGAYYLVVSNKFATSGLKRVTAAFALRHKNWWR